MSTMNKVCFARIGTEECCVDMRDDPECPPDMIRMHSERPVTGEWIAQPDGTWAEKVITLAEQTETERQWAMAELARSDRALTLDFPASSTDREKIMAYRAQLRNPLRSNHKDFPDPAWRPQWPEGVKRPAT